MKYLWQFTHDDLDGGGCAVVAAHLFPGHKHSVEYCAYHGPKSINSLLLKFLENYQPMEGEEHTLLITDILPRVDVCDTINLHSKKFARVTAYDHHDTTLWARNNEKYPWIFHGGVCGARLLYESVPTDIPLHNFVYEVDAWDRWLLESHHRVNGETLNLIYREIGSAEFYRSFTENIMADSNSWLSKLGVHLREKRDLWIRSELLRLDEVGKCFVDVLGRRALILLGGEYIGEFADAILKAHVDIDYVLFLLPASNSISLRSRKNSEVDVGQIAKGFPGGGGHQSAAGFEYPMRETLFVGAVGALQYRFSVTPGEV